VQLAAGLFDENLPKFPICLFFECSFPVIIGFGFRILAALVLNVCPYRRPELKLGFVCPGLLEWVE
jgi:hypothetical protein